MASAFVLIKFVTGAFAAPVTPQLAAAAGNTTILKTEIVPGWADSATNRGTSDILWNCVVTLTACVYTAIHLNVPEAHHSKWGPLWAKIRWAGLALLAPELVLFTALTQYRDARRLCAQLNELKSGLSKKASNEPQAPTSNAQSYPHTQAKSSDVDERLEKTTPDDEKFNLTYGFWVVMGGFVVSTSHLHNIVPYFTLGPEAVKLLAEQGHFLKISNEEIDDRSKTNTLAKSLVCIQLAWMVIQCFDRFAAGYPVTLLEIHTMVHAVCAWVIYGLWAKKPQDVQGPVEVDASSFQDLLALMMIGARPPIKSSIHAESDYLTYYGRQSNTEGQHEDSPQGSPTGPKIITHCGLRHPPTTTIPSEDSIVTLIGGQSLQCGLGPHEPYRLKFHLNQKDVSRWELACEAILRYHIMPRGLSSIESPVAQKSDLSHCCPSYIPNFPKRVLKDLFKTKVKTYSFGLVPFHWVIDIHCFLKDYTLPCALMLLPFLYGSIHLSAWNFAFPSSTEHLLWKIASLGIMVGLPSLFIVNTLFAVAWYAYPVIVLGKDADRLMIKFRFYIEKVLFSVLNPCILRAGAFCYGACRLYLVLEAFLSLRVVPVGVYAAVPWVQSLPHL